MERGTGGAGITLLLSAHKDRGRAVCPADDANGSIFRGCVAFPDGLITRGAVVHLHPAGGHGGGQGVSHFHKFPGPFHGRPHVGEVILRQPGRFQVFDRQHAGHTGDGVGKLHGLSGRCRELHRFGRLFPLGKGQRQAGNMGGSMFCCPGKAPLPEIPALFRVKPVVLHDVPRRLFTAANDLLFGAEGVIIFPGTAAVLHGFAVDGYTWQIVKRTKRETNDPTVSRMTVSARGEPATLAQIKKQLRKLEDVIEIFPLDDDHSVYRELVLIKVEADHSQRPDIVSIVNIFRAQIVDVAPNSLVVEVTGDHNKINGILTMLDTFNITEIVRTGIAGIGRGLDDFDMEKMKAKKNRG